MQRRHWCLTLALYGAGCTASDPLTADEAWQLLRLQCAALSVGTLSSPPPSTTSWYRRPRACTPLNRRLAATMLESAAVEGAGPAVWHRAGVAALYDGDVERAVQRISRATTTAEADAAHWNDLAVAYLLRATETDGLADVVRALDAAVRANDLAPGLPAATANLAYAEQHLGLPPPGTELRESRVLALAARRDVTPAEIGEHRDLLAEVVERHWMKSWAESIVGGTVSAAEPWLARSRQVAGGMAAAGGDASVAALVEELAAGGGPDTAIIRRAGAWLGYLAATAAFEGNDVDAASREFARARPSLLAVGPGVATRVALLGAALDRVHGDTMKALHDMRDHAASPFRTFPVADARRRWQRGLLLQEIGREAEAVAEWRSAQATFARFSEREGDGMVSALMGPPAADRLDWESTWRVQQRAHRSVPFARALRREAVGTGSAWHAAAMGLARAASHLRRTALDAARARGSKEGEAFLLSDEAADAIGAGSRMLALASLDSAASALDSVGDTGVRDMLRTVLDATRAKALKDVEPEQALRHIDAAIGAHRDRNNAIELPQLLQLRGEVQLRLGEAADAALSFEAGIVEAERDAGQVSTPESAVSLRAVRWDLYRGVAKALVAQGRAERAHEVVERGRFGVDASPRPKTSSVPPGVAILSLLDLDSSFSGWFRTAQVSETFSVAMSSAEAASGVVAMRAAIEAGKDVRPHSRRLSDALLSPFAKALSGVETLMVCVDGPLVGLPFGLLDLGGRLLLERTAIAVSTSCLDVPVSHVLPENTQALVVGDPDRRAQPSTRALPSADREAARIGAMYGGATVVRGAAATVSAVRSALPRAGVFHFAGHALAHPSRPDLSRLLLSPSGDDGELLTSQVERLRLSDTLVVLAACETGAGLVRPGGGVAGLADAFLRAGAASVVATYWPVPDAESAGFFTQFHEEMRRGASSARALRTAQLSAKAAGVSSAVWGGVALYSRPRNSTSPSGRQ